MSENKTPELNQDLANQMLQSVFESCDVTPNTVPIEDLESYTEYREDKFRAKKRIILVILALFLCIPLFFSAPRVSHVDQEDADPYPKYHIDVDSILPVKSVTASIDGKKVNVYEVQPKVYSIEPESAGPMLVTVKTINGQYTTHKIKVTAMDKEAPKVVSNTSTGGSLVLYLADNESGIDYDNIYAMNVNGDKIKPSGYDSDEGRVAFDFPKTSINIFIPDKAGNTLQLAVTLK